jgi:hypothetical protein
METTLSNAFPSNDDATARTALQNHASTAARDAAGSLYERVKRSSLFGNGLLLMLVGFLGLFSGLTLQVQDFVISTYVLLFGSIMCAFATGLGQGAIKTYFGFMYTSYGQLMFLVVAGNLAWSISRPLGIAAAIASNVHGFYAWKSGLGGETPGLASLRRWRRAQGS